MVYVGDGFVVGMWNHPPPPPLSELLMAILCSVVYVRLLLPPVCDSWACVSHVSTRRRMTFFLNYEGAWGWIFFFFFWCVCVCVFLFSTHDLELNIHQNSFPDNP